MTNWKKGINTETKFTDFAYIYFITDSQNINTNVTHGLPIKTPLFSAMCQEYFRITFSRPISKNKD